MSQIMRPLSQFFRDRNATGVAKLLDLNAEIRRLTEQLRKLHFDRDLLIYQTRVFSKLVFDKLALEAPLVKRESRNVDVQIIQVLLSRTKAVSQHFDSQTFQFDDGVPSLLSKRGMKGKRKTASRRVGAPGLYLSRRRAARHLSQLQYEHLKLTRSSYAIKQLLLRFDEDNAVLRQDIALLKQTPPALDPQRAAETWNKLASVQLTFVSEAEKRRSIASQRRMSALSQRRMSRTGSMTSGMRPQAMAPPLIKTLPMTSSQPRLDAYSGTRAVLSQHTNAGQGGYAYPARYSIMRQSSNASRLRGAEARASKRMSIVSMGKRSGAILDDWEWNGGSSDVEDPALTQSGAVSGAENRQSTSSASQLGEAETSVSTTASTSVSSSVGNTSTSTQASSIPPIESKPARPRSFVARQDRYSTYDQYGRRQHTASVEEVLADIKDLVITT